MNVKKVSEVGEAAHATVRAGRPNRNPSRQGKVGWIGLVWVGLLLALVAVAGGGPAAVAETHQASVVEDTRGKQAPGRRGRGGQRRGRGRR